jgi:hypothetical protein
MADAHNPGQFGNRKDTTAMASKGGQASTGKFGDMNGTDAAAAQKKELRTAKVRSGKNSHEGQDAT